MVYSKYDLKIYMGELASTNYFNPSKRIVRAVLGGKSFDFHLLLSTSEIPNPNRHLLILLSNEETIESRGVSEENLKYKPGDLKDGTSSDIPFGGALLINKQQSYATTNPQNASSSMNAESGAMSDLDKVLVAITPPSTRHYTNNNQSADGSQPTNNNESFGIFMNEKSVFLKSAGGSITLSESGVHIGGNLSLESTQFSKDLVADNFLASIIPSAFPTCVASMQQLPNFQQFVRIAQSAIKMVAVADMGKKAITSIKDITGALSG
jgi:hypothetical protein